jgi:hypothetical protein
MFVVGCFTTGICWFFDATLAPAVVGFAIGLVAVRLGGDFF